MNISSTYTSYIVFSKLVTSLRKFIFKSGVNILNLYYRANWILTECLVRVTVQQVVKSTQTIIVITRKNSTYFWETQWVIHIKTVGGLKVSQNSILLQIWVLRHWIHCVENDGVCQNKSNDRDNDGDNVDQDSQ